MHIINITLLPRDTHNCQNMRWRLLTKWARKTARKTICIADKRQQYLRFDMPFLEVSM